MKKFIILSSLLLCNSVCFAQDNPSKLNIATSIYISICAMLVFFMSIPAIGLFYSGLIRAKNALSVLTQCLIISALSFIIFYFIGYSLCFDDSANLNNFIGGLDNIALKNIDYNSIKNGIPEYLYFIFQTAFASISACIIVGSLVERIKFKALCISICFYLILAYCPIAHMVWSGGFIDKYFQAYDFAGGLVVHINAASFALIGAYMTGSRIDLGKTHILPHSLPLSYLGTGLLWLGWIGFNTGSELGVDNITGLVFLNTLLTPSISAITWLLIEVIFFKKASMLGASSGVLAGLVAITPACAYISPTCALILGIISAIGCIFGVHRFKSMLKIDDSLDVFGIHGIGAIIGGIFTGIFCSPSLGGLGYKGSHTLLSQFLAQCGSIIFTLIYSAIIGFIGFYVAKKLCNNSLRVQKDEERQGLDIITHGERAY